MTNELSVLNQQLLEKYGLMIGGKDLYMVLGFKTYGSFRLANERQEIPVKVFKIPKRRDWYALTNDLAQWLLSLTQARDSRAHERELEM
jgi:hypothetical protein